MNSTSNEHCDNCGKDRHTKPNLWVKERGNEGQHSRQKKLKKTEMSIESEAVADNKTNDDDLFAFTCTSAFSAVADVTPASTNSFGACTDSSASGHYFPDKSKFINY